MIVSGSKLVSWVGEADPRTGTGGGSPGIQGRFSLKIAPESGIGITQHLPKSGRCRPQDKWVTSPAFASRRQRVHILLALRPDSWCDFVCSQGFDHISADRLILVVQEGVSLCF